MCLLYVTVLTLYTLAFVYRVVSVHCKLSAYELTLTVNLVELFVQQRLLFVFSDPS